MLLPLALRLTRRAANLQRGQLSLGRHESSLTAVGCQPDRRTEPSGAQLEAKVHA